jgi:hypothetical protein
MLLPTYFFLYAKKAKQLGANKQAAIDAALIIVWKNNAGRFDHEYDSESSLAHQPFISGRVLALSCLC